MSARKAARPDLALAPVRTHWLPKPGDRVRRDDQTTLSARMRGTAEVIYVNVERNEVAVSRDVVAYNDLRLTTWALDRVRRATAVPNAVSIAAGADAR